MLSKQNFIFYAVKIKIIGISQNSNEVFITATKYQEKIFRADG